MGRVLLGWSGARDIDICPTKRRERSHTVLGGAARKVQTRPRSKTVSSLSLVSFSSVRGFPGEFFLQGFHGPRAGSVILLSILELCLSLGNPHLIAYSDSLGGR